jgi:hypothetical protein
MDRFTKQLCGSSVVGRVALVSTAVPGLFSALGGVIGIADGSAGCFAVPWHLCKWAWEHKAKA